LIVLAPDFMTKIGKKAAQDFFCAVSKVFDRVKTVALWSAKKIKIKRTIKGYGSAATFYHAESVCFKSVIQSGRSLFLSKIKNTSLKLPVGISSLQLVNLHRNRRYFVI
jgi:hypothetical protein